MDPVPIFGDDERRQLLWIARKSIYCSLKNEPFEFNSPYESLKREYGLFVTLKNHGKLRGCLGRFEAKGIVLEQSVAVMAVESATHDVRFKPVFLEELPDIDIQISVLTPLERVSDLGDITIGLHGLQVRGKTGFGSWRGGTLLPQVAVEHNWDVPAFVSATCVKAGLDADAWRNEETEVYKYGAEVFGDLEYGLPPFPLDDEAI